MPINYALLRQFINPTDPDGLQSRTFNTVNSAGLGGIFGYEQPDAIQNGVYPVAPRNETGRGGSEIRVTRTSTDENGVPTTLVTDSDGNPLNHLPGGGVGGTSAGGVGRGGSPTSALQFAKNSVFGPNLQDWSDYEADALPRYDAATESDRAARAGALAAQGFTISGLNESDAAYLNDFRGAMQRGDAGDQDTLSRLRGVYNSINPVTLAPFQSAGPSQAAQAYADPASIAAQNRFLSQLTGVAGGSLNGVSQGAQAYADPASIAAQTRALNSLFAASGGQLDVTSQGALAFADPNSIEGQRRALEQFQRMAGGGMDLESLAAVAAADPESIEAQKFALAKYKGLTDPTVTAEERFIMELARRNEEQDRRASVEAALRDLEVRGVRGSGAEIGALLGAQQTTSQNRLLQDLGAEANAIQRSQQALAGYTGLANTIRGQSFTEDFNTRAAGDAMNLANRDVRIRGIEDDADLQSRIRDQSFNEAFSRGTAADNVAITNSNRRLAATTDAGNLASTQRAQSWDESYGRGIAADNMYNQNANRQLTGMTAGAGLSTDMRNASFLEAFRRGDAADVMARHNQQMLQDDNHFRADMGLRQNNDIWGRGMDLTRTELDVTGRADDRAGRVYDAGTGTNRTTYERSSDYWDNIRGDTDAGTRLALGRIGLGGDIVSGRTGARTSGGALVNDAWRPVFAEQALNRGLAELNKPQPKSLFRRATGIDLSDII